MSGLKRLAALRCVLADYEGFKVVLSDPILCLLGLNTFLTQFGKAKVPVLLL